MSPCPVPPDALSCMICGCIRVGVCSPIASTHVPLHSTRPWPSHGQRRRRLPRMRIPVVLPLHPLLLHPPTRPSSERRDLFLCHAWDDRKGAAREMCDLLVSLGATVWFSERDVGLGKSLLREIDRGLANSRIGIVLVTPALLKTLAAEGIADKELSALLATDRVIPVAHGTTFDALRDVSPLLAARPGLSTGDSSMRDVATKVAAAAAVEDNT
jgi:TIR domain